jgi:hypothetical protein
MSTKEGQIDCNCGDSCQCAGVCTCGKSATAKTTQLTTKGESKSESKGETPKACGNKYVL